ncbi:zf-HC2 domain-containing protein [Marinobacterium sp. YM272]|uniref:zf-HC2 domain-containing protein n=1 Tax=Marinobacterium sp. YM272 TaxID=3421654 RepID=UPI003D7F878F
MTMACKRATELMSIQIDRPLSLSERLSLRTHLMMCRYCRRCDKQFQMLRRITGKRREDEPPQEH